MTTASSLATRMKALEAVHRTVLPARTYTVLRVDGRAFHTYLRHAQKPFDAEFAAAMDQVAEALCAEIMGAAFAYSQSDEVSVLFTDFARASTQPWFGGVTAKQVSVAASLAAAVLAEQRPGHDRAVFDARVLTLPTAADVTDYFRWRQMDAVRNSVSMTARAHFSHRRLNGVPVPAMRELLAAEAGVDWFDLPAGFRQGRVTTRHTGPLPVEYVDGRTQQTVRTTALRSWWQTSPAPEFTREPAGWLAAHIPYRPSDSGPSLDTSRSVGVPENAGTPHRPLDTP
ncbi:tRNA(His) guanylyltransferase Thg1 family protein [Streptomyces sp. NPDC094468]|uniref:tRNA(His) guanylyltransferase Thg1 family protein n=1 Tax=Streptomyces sp. NPDC094468 TaxID=3366066 RepID=UPI0038106893